MKPSETKLGLELQLYLLRQGVQLDALAQQMGITADGLSNLVHGRRRFKDETLARLAKTEILRRGGFTLRRLKALRAIDEYPLEELVLAVAEYIRQGEIERLPDDFFERLKEELSRPGFPPLLDGKTDGLFALMQAAQP